MDLESNARTATGKPVFFIEDMPLEKLKKTFKEQDKQSILLPELYDDHELPCGCYD